MICARNTIAGGEHDIYNSKVINDDEIYRSMSTSPPLVADDFTAMDDDALAAAVSTLAAHIHAATYRLLVLVAELDRR